VTRIDDPAAKADRRLQRNVFQYDPCKTSGANRLLARHTTVHHTEARAIIAMRVLNDSRPTVGADALSAPPLLVTPELAAGMVGEAQLQPAAGVLGFSPTSCSVLGFSLTSCSDGGGAQHIR